jgi:hypothetical protein
MPRCRTYSSGGGRRSGGYGFSKWITRGFAIKSGAAGAYLDWAGGTFHSLKGASEAFWPWQVGFAGLEGLKIPFLGIKPVSSPIRTSASSYKINSDHFVAAKSGFN